MRIDPMRTQTVGGATQEVDETLRRLRVVFMCIVGYVGLWDVTATFGAGRLASDLARRGDIHCNAVWRPDGQVLQHDDRCQSHAVAPFFDSNGIELVRFDVCQGESDLFVWVPGYTSPFLRLRQWRH